MHRIIILDATNIQFRAIFAYRQNTAIPCIYTFLRMIVGYFKKLNVTLDDTIILALDYGTWRKDYDKKYKAQRQEFRESFEEKEWWEARYKEFNDLYEKIALSMPIHIIKLYKREADDIASVGCRYYKDSEVILISSDKDWEMLCHFPNVKLFSPISKKFKIVKAPMKVLMDKIVGDISDNLLDKPSSEAEFERRKKIVDLTSLPKEIELPIKETLQKLLPKNLYIHKIPFRSVQEQVKLLYKLED